MPKRVSSAAPSVQTPPDVTDSPAQVTSPTSPASPASLTSPATMHMSASDGKYVCLHVMLPTEFKLPVHVHGGDSLACFSSLCWYPMILYSENCLEMIFFFGVINISSTILSHILWILSCDKLSRVLMSHQTSAFHVPSDFCFSMTN